MRTVDQLLRAGELTELVTLLGTPEHATVAAVEACEDLGALTPEGRDRLLVLGTHASHALMRDPALDITLHELSRTGITGLITTGLITAQAGTEASFPAEMHDTATRLGICLLAAPATHTLTDLIITLHGAHTGDGADALGRVMRFVQRLHAADNGAHTLERDTLIAWANAALDTEFNVADTEGAGQTPTVQVPPRSGVLGSADRITATLLQQLLDAAQLREAHHTSGVHSAQEAILGEMLVGTAQQAQRVAHLAREAGITIDGWHEAYVLRQSEQVDPLDYAELIETGLAVLARLTDRARWSITRAEHDLVLWRHWNRDPRPLNPHPTRAYELLELFDALTPHAPFRCGVGDPHPGVAGLRTTVQEGRLALSTLHDGPVAQYSQMGVRSLIVELASSDAARTAAETLLAPLTALTPSKTSEHLHTLSTYLDEHGSLQRTAARLAIHRNSVSYRIDHIKQLLRTDLTDPEERLALQLACRTHLNLHGPTT